MVLHGRYLEIIQDNRTLFKRWAERMDRPMYGRGDNTERERKERKVKDGVLCAQSLCVSQSVCVYTPTCFPSKPVSVS